MNHRHLLALLLIAALAIQVTMWLDPVFDPTDESVHVADHKPATASQSAGRNGRPAKQIRPVTIDGEEAFERSTTTSGQSHPPQRPDEQNNTDARTPVEGERPVLALSYDSLGFERYIRLAEQLGRFHLLIDGQKLGPPVSLVQRRLLEQQNRSMATARPYRVTDAAITERLPPQLPRGASTRHAALVLHSWADRALWQAVEAAVAEQDVDFAAVEAVQGHYARGTASAYVELERAILRSSNRAIDLDKRIKLP